MKFSKERIEKMLIGRYGSVRSLEDKFRKHVVPIADPDACWPWQGQVNDSGYGIIRHGPAGTCALRAHRVSLEMSLGRPIRPGLHVLHSCDNPPCVNPRHLREGTQAENVADAVARGRMVAPPKSARRGEECPHKLTEADVITIKRELGALRCGDVARRFGVTHSTISMVRSGKRWAHVA